MTDAENRPAVPALDPKSSTWVELGITEIEREVCTGRLLARERVEDALVAADTFGEPYGVFIARTDTSALETGAAIDAAVRNGSPVGPLAGTTVAVKDFIATRDAPTTAQSLVHDTSWFGGRDAPVVARLRAAGAAVVGKTSMAEHAMGRIDPARPFPVPRNPWDPGRWPGGSSCGSAIAVSLGLVDAALGTDTTGSVRIPAAFCGITGLRPTLGLVPIEGCMPASPSLDVVGPLARSARDCAALLAVIAPETANASGRSAAKWRERIDGVIIGVPSAKLKEWSTRIDPAIQALFERALCELVALGAEIVSFDWPEATTLETTMMSIVRAEVFTEHVEELRARWTEFGRSFRRLAVLGASIPQEAVIAARANLAAAQETLFARMSKAQVDSIAMPTWAQPPPLYASGVASKPDDLNLTAVWSATGQPVVATPMGFDAYGLPASLQLVGRIGDDLHLLEIADAYERATGWNRCPPINLGPFPAVPDPDEGAPVSTPEERAPVEALLRPLGILVEDGDFAPIARMLATSARLGLTRS